MNGSGTRSSMAWGTRLLIALALVLAGAAATVWSLAHFRPAATFLGITSPASESRLAEQKPVVQLPAQQAPTTIAPADDQRISALEQRLNQVENATQRAEGSAGRADALVVAFAARRAVDRGVALGYLENLLVDRFGQQHQAAVATVITGSHQPVRLEDLTSEYETLGPVLRAGGPQDNWWLGFKRELGSLVEVHRAERPATNPEARYNRALQRLSSGDVDLALAETMRLPGAANASQWTQKAHRYIAVHRALDEIESAALLGGNGSR